MSRSKPSADSRVEQTCDELSTTSCKKLKSVRVGADHHTYHQDWAWRDTFRCTTHYWSWTLVGRVEHYSCEPNPSSEAGSWSYGYQTDLERWPLTHSATESTWALWWAASAMLCLFSRLLLVLASSRAFCFSSGVYSATLFFLSSFLVNFSSVDRATFCAAPGVDCGGAFVASSVARGHRLSSSVWPDSSGSPMIGFATEVPY